MQASAVYNPTNFAESPVAKQAPYSALLALMAAFTESRFTVLAEAVLSPSLLQDENKKEKASKQIPHAGNNNFFIIVSFLVECEYKLNNPVPQCGRWVFPLLIA